MAYRQLFSNSQICLGETAEQLTNYVWTLLKTWKIHKKKLLPYQQTILITISAEFRGEEINNLLNRLKNNFGHKLIGVGSAHILKNAIQTASDTLLPLIYKILHQKYFNVFISTHFV